MIDFSHTFEISAGKAVLTTIDIIATIAAADQDRPEEWYVDSIEAQGVVETVNGNGEPDWRVVMTEISRSHPLFSLIVQDLYDTCRTEIDHAWGYYLDEQDGELDRFRVNSDDEHRTHGGRL